MDRWPRSVPVDLGGFLCLNSLFFFSLLSFCSLAFAREGAGYDTHTCTQQNHHRVDLLTCFLVV